MKFWKLVSAVIALILSASVNAASLIDQDNSFSSGAFGYIDDLFVGQSFQQDQTNISGAGIFLNPGHAGSGNFTISIYENYSSTPSGLIASGTSDLVNQDSGWVDVFWTPEAILASNTYYIVLEDTAFSGLVVSHSDGDSYSLGNAFWDGYTYPTYDLSFRTYYDDAAVVPVPAAVWLFGSGLIGLVSLARRKKA